MRLIHKLYQSFIPRKKNKLQMIFDRINGMQNKNNYPDININIVKDKSDYICSLENLEKDMVSNLRKTSCSAEVIDSVSHTIHVFKKELEDNQNIEKMNPSSFSSAFSHIVKSLRQKKNWLCTRMFNPSDSGIWIIQRKPINQDEKL